MPIALDQTRREWELGHRRLQQEVREAPSGEPWLAELEAVTGELRRRVGQTFTLAELADAYAGADRWARDVVGERAPFPGWVRTVSDAEAAAFHAYQRGATDYAS
jgi:hypothetical protein